MRKWILTLAAVLSGLAAGEARAVGGCNGPFCGLGHGAAYGGSAYGPKVGFLAAPWYLYWPYDAHFQLPAPIYGAYYPPPAYGGWYSQPFFPAQPVPYVPGSPLNTYPFGTSPPAAAAPAAAGK
ncbi:MAG TPA: hypothetical protein VIL46_14030 [Gemmataceae bacterium]